MERHLEELERRLREDPGDDAIRLELVTALERAGYRARAFALLDHVVEARDAPELERRRSLLWGSTSPVEDLRLVLVDDEGPEVLCLAFDAAETRLASGRVGGELRVHGLLPDPTPGVFRSLDAHRRATSAVSFAPGDAQVVTGGGDGRVRLWDPERRSAERVLAGVASRPLTATLYRGQLAGSWRDRSHGLELAGGKAREWMSPFPCLLMDDLDAARRKARNDRVYELLEERFPDLKGQRRMHETTSWWGTGRPAEDVRHEVIGDPRRSCFAIVQQGRAEVFDLEGRLLWEHRAEAIRVPRGVSDNQPPAAALAPAGGALLLGSACRDSITAGRLAVREPPRRGSRRLKGAVLVLPGDPPRVLPLLPDHSISAVALSPSGGCLALGTRQGAVYMARLVESRLPTRDDLQEDLHTEVRLSPREDLSERPGPPATRPSDFTLLRKLEASELPIRAQLLKLEARHLWLYPGKPAPARPGVALADQAAFDRPLGLYDLATGESTVFPYVLHADGRIYVHEEQRRFLVFRHTAVWPAPDHVESPGLPDEAPPARMPSGRAAADRALGVTSREWLPSGSGALHAMRAVKRPQEFWILDPARPEEAVRFETRAPVTRMAWSPGGTRLAVLLRNGDVWIHGSLIPD